MPYVSDGISPCFARPRSFYARRLIHDLLGEMVHVQGRQVLPPQRRDLGLASGVKIALIWGLSHASSLRRLWLRTANGDQYRWCMAVSQTDLPMG